MALGFPCECVIMGWENGQVQDKEEQSEQCDIAHHPIHKQVAMCLDDGFLCHFDSEIKSQVQVRQLAPELNSS